MEAEGQRQRGEQRVSEGNQVTGRGSGAGPGTGNDFVISKFNNPYLFLKTLLYTFKCIKVCMLINSSSICEYENTYTFYLEHKSIIIINII